MFIPSLEVVVANQKFLLKLARFCAAVSLQTMVTCTWITTGISITYSTYEVLYAVCTSSLSTSLLDSFIRSLLTALGIINVSITYDIFILLAFFKHERQTEEQDLGECEGKSREKRQEEGTELEAGSLGGDLAINPQNSIQLLIFKMAQKNKKLLKGTHITQNYPNCSKWTQMAPQAMASY